MTIRFQCPQCNSPKSAADEHAGKMGKCKCGASFKIPSPVQEETEAILDLAAHSEPENAAPFSFDAFPAESQSTGLFEDFPPPQPTPYTNAQQNYGYSGTVYSENDSTERSNPNRNPPKKSQNKEIGNETKVEVDTTASAILGGTFGFALSTLLTGVYASANNMSGLLIMSILMGIAAVLSMLFSKYKDDVGITDLVENKGIMEKSNQRAVIVQHDKKANVKKAAAFSLWLLIFMAVPFLSLLAVFSLLGDSKINKEPEAKETLANETPPPVPTPVESLEEKMKRERSELEASKEELKLTPEELLALVEQNTKDLLTPEKIESRRTIPDEPQANIAQWSDCTDDLATDKYVESFVSLFGDLQYNPPASPSLRYVLFEDKLVDLETKSYRIFSGRRHHLTSAKRSFNQRILEISEDGTLFLVQAQSEDPQGTFQNMILLHKMDNSLIRTFQAATAAYFLPGNKILLKDEKEGYAVISGANFDEQTPYVKRDLLAISPNRKYIAFGGGKRMILEEDPATGPNGRIVRTPFDLTIYSSDSFSSIADATYENLGLFRQAFFSSDGKELLVTNNKRCSAISLADGKVSGQVHDLADLEICLGWVGNSSRAVAIMMQFSNGNFPMVRYVDIESGNRLFRSGENSDLAVIEYFRNSFVFDPQKRDKWLPIAKAEIENVLKNYSSGEVKPLPRKVKLSVHSSWKQPDGLLAVMKYVAENQLGLQVIDQQDTSEHFVLDVTVESVALKTIGVQFKASHQDGSFIWSASGVGDKPAEINDDPYQQQRLAESLLPAIVSAVNNLLLNHRLPESYRQGFVPQTEEGKLTDAAPMVPNREGLTAFTAAGTEKIDNSWLADTTFFDRSPLPVLDFEVPASSRTMDGEALKLIGISDVNLDLQVVLSYPGVGVFTVSLEPGAKATKLESLGDFTVATLNPSTKELLLMKEDSILFKPLAAGKRARTLKLESPAKGMVVSSDGKVLAVATDTQIQFYDLEIFVTKPRNPNLKMCDTSFDIAQGEMRFSENGKWFCAVSNTTPRRALMVNVEEKAATDFEVGQDTHKAFISNEGVFSCRGNQGHLFTWKRSAPGAEAQPEQMRNNDLMSSAVDGALSPAGDRYVMMHIEGALREAPYPETKPITQGYDPGRWAKESLKGVRIDWSPTGGYYYMLQRDRIVVWKSAQ